MRHSNLVVPILAVALILSLFGCASPQATDAEPVTDSLVDVFGKSTGFQPKPKSILRLSNPENDSFVLVPFGSNINQKFESPEVFSGEESITISGSVYGKNHIRIINIMGFEIDLRPNGIMLFIKNKDIPGVVGKVGTILGNNKVNISGYLLSKMKNKDYAYSVIKIDNNIDVEIIDKINTLSEILEVKQLQL